MDRFVRRSRIRFPKLQPPPKRAPAAPSEPQVEPPAPGRVLPGHWVLCHDGALPREYGNLTRAEVVSIGPKHTGVQVHGESMVRRVPNDLVSLDPRHKVLAAAYPPDPRDAPQPDGGRFTNPRGYRWLPHWSWIGWSVAEHQEYARGERPLEGRAAAPPRRLVIVGCGGKKADAKRRDAHGMYVGSYFQAARRAADALVRGDSYQVILSARYGLLDLHDVIERYDLRMGQPGSVTAEAVAYQASQLGLAGTEEVIVLAGRAYADVVSAVWPHARRPLDGTAGIGEQLQRLAAITATGELPQPKEPIVSVFDRPQPPCDVHSAQLRAGDVIDVPGRGELTLASDGGVLSSAKPTWARFKVVGDEPFDIDVFHGGKVRLVKVAEPAPAKKPASPAKKSTTAKATRQPAASKREIPLAEVTWGMYGKIKAMGPDGSRRDAAGYVTKVPRVYTGGVGEKRKYKGEPILHFDIYEPPVAGGRGGYWIMMNALLGAMFTVLDPPKDRPLDTEPSDSRRMPVADLRADDIVTMDSRTPGQRGPRLYLTEDPKPVGEGLYDLIGLVNDVAETHQMHGDGWIDVEGPAVRNLAQRDSAAIERPAAEPVKQETAKPKTPAVEAAPAGATILCPGAGCGRQAKVKRDGTISAHYKYGKSKCGLVNEPVPAKTKVLRLPEDDDDATLFAELAEFSGAILAELGDGAATRQNADPTEPAAQETKSAELRMLEKVTKRTPVDAVEWGGDGRGPRVLARCVANGVYVEATGVDRDRKPITATGYVVEARGLRGGFGGWSRDPVIVVTLSDHPQGVGGVMVQMGEDDRVVVVGAPAGRHPGVGLPLVRMPVEHQVLTARHRLGLPVRVYDGPHNELWEVEGCKEILGSEVAWWLFGGTYGTWEGRAEPMFAARHIAAAIHAGRYQAGESPAMGVSDLVQECVIPDGLTEVEGRAEYDRLLLGGHLIDGAGAPLRAVDCFTCSTRKPHQITSGITCPYEIACPTCRADVNRPCKRPSEHRVWGGLHDSRVKLASQVDDARALAGDLRMPAPWPGKAAAARQAAAAAGGEGIANSNGPVNAGPVLDGLLAKVDSPGNAQIGRDAARAHAERYAAGLPLVRHKRQLDVAWTFVCPVPTCLNLYDGHATIRDAREAWFTHADGHDGFTPTWPDDVLPVEPEAEQQQTKRLRAAKSKRTGPPPAVIEIIEPVGNDWWDDSALAWERCGMLHRYEFDTPTGPQPVAILSIPQGYAVAVDFASLLGSVGGLNPDDMVIRVMTETDMFLAELRRDRADALARGRALRTVRDLAEVPPRPAGQVPTIVEVFAPPTDDPWWDMHLAGWEAAGMVKPWKYPPSAMWPGGVGTVKLITPWDEEQAGRWAADLVALAGLLPDRVRVYRAAAAPEPPPGKLEADAAAEKERRLRRRAKPDLPAAPYRYDRNSPCCQIAREANEVMATCTPETPTDLVAWAVGVKHACHASDLLLYLAFDRKPGRLQGTSVGGTIGKRHRQHSCDGRGCRVTEPADGVTYASGSTDIVKVTWARVAKLVDKALAADPGVVDRARVAEDARMAALRAADEEARSAAEDACIQVMVELWQSVRPAAPAAPVPPAPAVEVLALFDLDAIGAAVDAAFAAAQ